MISTERRASYIWKMLKENAGLPDDYELDYLGDEDRENSESLDDYQVGVLKSALERFKKDIIKELRLAGNAA